jgi:hypothetical protein
VSDSFNFSDGFEKEAMAKAMYIEFELTTRGDGCWRPWQDLDATARGRWYRIADAAARGINEYRFERREPA